MIIQELHERGLCSPPKWLASNCQYLTIMGSTSYGTNIDTSDLDVYGWTIPKLGDIFPTIEGEIPGFGRQKKRFETWQEHHILDKDALGGKGRKYDFCVYSITKFFQLAMENNPTCLDSLFTPANCLLHCTTTGQMVREKRHIFLHKGCFHRYKGYSFSQLHKMTIKNPIGKRKEDIETHRFDTKFAMHV